MKVHPVKPLSKDLIEQKANGFLTRIFPSALSLPKKTKVVEIAEFHLKDKFNWSLSVSDSTPNNILGFCNPTNRTLNLTEDTYLAALNGDARARFTCAHEIGHVVLHAVQMRILMVSLNPNTANMNRVSRSNLKSYVDPEWQANYFAGALLMPKNHIIDMSLRFSRISLTNKISEIFGVSKQAAEIRVEKLGV